MKIPGVTRSVVVGLIAAATFTFIFAPSALAAPTEYEQFKAFLEEYWQQRLERSPEAATYYGEKLNQDKWDDYSVTHADDEHQFNLAQYARLKQFNPAEFPSRGKLQYESVEHYLENRIDAYDWRFHGYAVSQEYSPIDDCAAFLINFHAIDNVDDARAYISRVEAIPLVVDGVIEWLHAQAAHGVRPPAFVYPKIIENTNGLLSGYPFDETGSDATLMAAFKRKLDKVDIVEDQETALEKRLADALLTRFKPALETYKATLGQLQEKTTLDDGVWKLPRGGEYYNSRLAYYTTLDVTADEIHELGLAEVERIHSELERVQEEIGFEGDLPSFLAYMRDDPRWYYAETDEGREQYLSATREAINRIKLKVDEYFNLKPKADVVVKRVEPFREKNTSAAFYNSPAIDGSRPGIYYVPLYRMRDNSRWDMITTAYHEAIPGHHMQIAIAQELDDTPMLLKVMFVGAYVEGWALYAELLAKEMGMYKNDPVGDFGRLTAELFRAVRLVVDTGIHSRRWTRRQAIDYMAANTSFTESYISGEIERYIVWPGQATSYKIGMLKILELRERAKSELGDRFDIRRFHDIVLSDGQLALPILEKKVDSWIATNK